MPCNARHLLDVKSYSQRNGRFQQFQYEDFFAFHSHFQHVLLLFSEFWEQKIEQHNKSFNLVYLDFLQLFSFPRYRGGKTSKFFPKIFSFFLVSREKLPRISRFSREIKMREKWELQSNFKASEKFWRLCYMDLQPLINRFW